MNNKFFIGIDTSNYTTSVAVISCNGDVVSLKRLLEVKDGEKGLRQSQALFFHIQNLPSLIAELFEKIDPSAVKAIGVSTRPRNIEGSYMPCFLAGKTLAYSLSSALKVPVYEFSHQEGHIASAILGLSTENRDYFKALSGFYAFHLSGGTNELLYVKESDNGYDASLVSRTADITLGQLIDRCGVKLGMNFPCGEEMDNLALKSGKKFRIKISSNELGVNLSGFENKFNEMIENGYSPVDSSKMIFDVVYETIKTMLNNVKDLPVLFAGGVMRSKCISRMFENNPNYFFTNPDLSSDNAAGVASLCRKAFVKRNG